MTVFVCLFFSCRHGSLFIYLMFPLLFFFPVRQVLLFDEQVRIALACLACFVSVVKSFTNHFSASLALLARQLFKFTSFSTLVE